MRLHQWCFSRTPRRLVISFDRSLPGEAQQRRLQALRVPPGNDRPSLEDGWQLCEGKLCGGGDYRMVVGGASLVRVSVRDDSELPAQSVHQRNV